MKARSRRLVRGAVLAGSMVGLASQAHAAPDVLALTGSPEARTAMILSDLSKAWFRGEWEVYRGRFVSADGRVIDNANGGVSHSEGQGYGLVLALEAGDAAGFQTIWQWTAEHLRVRSDALFAWKWDPAKGAVADRNNATDGDILIAWALARAAKRFGRPDYDGEARAIAADIGAKLVRPSAFGPVLMPAEQGFGPADQPDGPVVNLSYWIFPALRDFAALGLAPGTDWNEVRQTGYRLLAKGRFGAHLLPADWESLAGPTPAPARNFPASFGYDALRIPLYLAGDPDAPHALLYPFIAADLDVVAGRNPSVIDVATGLVGQPMAGGGYRAVFALARCAVHGEAIPTDLMSSRDGLYYPETLRLLTFSIVQERFARCL